MEKKSKMVSTYCCRVGYVLNYFLFYSYIYKKNCIFCLKCVRLYWNNCVITLRLSFRCSFEMEKFPLKRYRPSTTQTSPSYQSVNKMVI